MKKLLWLAVCIMFLGIPVQIFAGQSSAILGTEDFFAGALPPPGFHFINYLTYVKGDKLKDEDGHTNNEIDFDLNVVADVLRFIYVSDIKVLGADLGWHVICPIVYQDLELRPPVGGFDEDHFGLGDCYFSPFILGWHSEIFHWVLGLDIITPTGQYSKRDNASIGSNHWTFEPAFAVSMICPSGLSASVKMMYDIHTKNTDHRDHGTRETIDYLTGQQFHLDYNAGYMIADNFRLGVCGYYLKGVQDDKLDGTKESDSKEQCFAVGPSAMYSFNPGLHLVAKAQFETYAEHRPEVDKYWLKLIYSF